MQPQSSTQNLSAISSIKSPTLFYEWQKYRCAYDVYQPTTATEDSIPLLLIHPIGVGLSRVFWQRFCETWYKSGNTNPIYNPDLLGCGDGDLMDLHGYAPLFPRQFGRGSDSRPNVVLWYRAKILGSRANCAFEILRSLHGDGEGRPADPGCGELKGRHGSGGFRHAKIHTI